MNEALKSLHDISAALAGGIVILMLLSILLILAVSLLVREARLIRQWMQGYEDQPDDDF